MIKGASRFLAVLLSAGAALAQEDVPVDPPPQPAPTIKELDAERVQVGDVILNRKTREIRFPAQVNMAGDELLEFAIVQVRGKVHESLLSTAISPLHLNVAFKLLRYQPSPELYPEIKADGTLSEHPPAVPEEIKAAARLAVDVEWSDDGKTRTASINDWIMDSATGKAMAPDPWVYGGPLMSDGRYVPSANSDILATFLGNTAIASFSGKDNDTDQVWLPFPKRVPPVGSAVTVIIRPFLSKPSPAKP
jgi:hypothetical protein